MNFWNGFMSVANSSAMGELFAIATMMAIGIFMILGAIGLYVHFMDRESSD